MNNIFNNSQEAAAAAEQANAKVVGLIPFKVLALNPTQEWLISNFNPKAKAPDYSVKQVTKDDKTFNQFRVDIYMSGEPTVKDGDEEVQKTVKIKHSIWIENRTLSTQAGDDWMINEYGNVYTAGTIENYKDADWMKGEDFRQAYSGEEDLNNFIRAYGCVKANDAYRFSDIEGLLKGNIKELKTVFKQLIDMDNEVYLLIGINNKGYSEVYRKKYFSASNGTPTRAKTFVEKVGKDGMQRNLFSTDTKPVVYEYTPSLIKDFAPSTEAVKQEVEQVKEEAGTSDGDDW